MSQRARMSREFNSRKGSQPTKFKQRPWIFVKLSFRELCDSKLSSLHPFDNIAIIHWIKNRSKTERWAVSSRDTTPWSNFYNLHWELTCHNKWHLGTSETFTTPEKGTQFMPNMALKLPQYFYLLMKKRLGHYFQAQSLYYQVAQCKQKTPVPVASRWQVRSEKAKKW